MHQPQFGKFPSGARLERMKDCPRYRSGAFYNLSKTPALSEGVGYYKVMKEFFCEKSDRNVPSSVLPSVKTDLHSIPANKEVIVWFGHSSYYMQLAGKKILVDPVFSGNASPVRFTTKSFPGADVYKVEDIPELDYLIISHDHYDHLDYKTVKELQPKVKKVLCGLGVGEHLEYWGYDPAKIIEKDWYEEVILDDQLTAYTLPARHFSGRGLKRNNTLWMSYILQSPTKKIYLGGDSGYDTHFAEIGEKYGPFDLAILENGQYNENWKYIHMMPEQTVLAAIQLEAKMLFPVHWAKFDLGGHAWDEPIIRVTAEAEQRGMRVMHPMIGELEDLNRPREYSRWWEAMK